MKYKKKWKPKKTEIVCFKCTPLEKHRIEHASEKQGIPVSKWISGLIKREIDHIGVTQQENRLES